MGPGGFTVPPRKIMSAIAQAANRPGDFTDRELRERAGAMMKQSTLFPRMSWRLLDDLIAFDGLRVAGEGDERDTVNFVALVVLEGTIIVRTGPVGNEPALDSPIERNLDNNPVELVPGVYSVTDGVFPQPPPPADSTRRIESPRGQRNRYWALTLATLARLPAQALAGINLDKLPPAVVQELLS